MNVLMSAAKVAIRCAIENEIMNTRLDQVRVVGKDILIHLTVNKVGDTAGATTRIMVICKARDINTDVMGSTTKIFRNSQSLLHAHFHLGVLSQQHSNPRSL